MLPSMLFSVVATLKFHIKISVCELTAMIPTINESLWGVH